MSGTSTKTRRYTIRLRNETADEIERLIKTSPKNPHDSVGDYCKEVVERYVWRHSTRKYRRQG